MRWWLGQTFASSTLPQSATDPLIGVRANTKKQQYAYIRLQIKNKEKEYLTKA
jgi:hypothetical protein